MRRTRRLFAIVALLLLPACSDVRVSSLLPGPTAVSGVSGSSLPAASVEFVVSVPADSTTSAIALEIVDPMTGIDYNSRQTMMERQEDGRYAAQLPLSLGSLIRYRYLSVEAPRAYEATASGKSIRYRVAHINSPMQIQDQIAAWEGASYSAETGRILGQVLEKGSGRPVPEMILTASGKMTFSDGEGQFRIEGLLPGLTNLVAYHPSGAYQVFQQGAMVAPGATTPVQLDVEPAAPVTLTFEVTVPEGTPATPSIAGNVLQLGDIFAADAGALEISAARAPELIPVDDRNFIFLTQLHAGTDLRYKYTLGDGLWNAERSPSGNFVTRQLIVPETDFVMRDNIASWGADSNPTHFELQVPPSTPPEDEIGVQFNPFTWFEPLPMVTDGSGVWTFELLGPVDFPGEVRYRYCRNLVCSAGESGQPERVLDPSMGGRVSDEIESWAWWRGESAPVEVVAATIPAREAMELGVELVPAYEPSWPRYREITMERARSVGSNVVTLTPAWTLTGTDTVPRIEFDPARAPFEVDLLQLSRAARDHGMSVILRPEFAGDSKSQEDWWESARRDSNWWAVYYAELRSFLLSQATVAKSIGATKLVLTGSQLYPSVSGGTLPSGVPSNAPFEAIEAWDEIVDEMRESYSGTLAWEVELTDRLLAVPPFLEQLDEVHVYWHAPLAETEEPSMETLELEAERLIDLILLPPLPSTMPVVLSVEYPSVVGATSACPRTAEGSCSPIERLDIFAAEANALTADPQAQAEAYNAVLLAAHDRPRIEGFLSRRFLPIALEDLSASVYGKPAGDVLWYWYPRLQGGASTP